MLQHTDFGGLHLVQPSTTLCHSKAQGGLELDSGRREVPASLRDVPGINISTGFEATTVIAHWAESFDGKGGELPFPTLSFLLLLLSTPNHAAILKMNRDLGF